MLERTTMFKVLGEKMKNKIYTRKKFIRDCYIIKQQQQQNQGSKKEELK